MPFSIAITTTEAQQKKLEEMGYTRTEVWIKYALSKESGEKELFGMRGKCSDGPPYQFAVVTDYWGAGPD